MGKWKSLSCVRLFATPWTIQSMEFSTPEDWSGWPFPSPGDLPNTGIESRSPALQADSLPTEPQGNGGGGLVIKSCPALETPWTVACQAPLSVGFSRQEYWRGLPFPSPGDLSDPGIEPRSPALQADSLPTELRGNPFKYFAKVLKYFNTLNI